MRDCKNRNAFYPIFVTENKNKKDYKKDYEKYGDKQKDKEEKYQDEKGDEYRDNKKDKDEEDEQCGDEKDKYEEDEQCGNEKDYQCGNEKDKDEKDRIIKEGNTIIKWRKKDELGKKYKEPIIEHMGESMIIVVDGKIKELKIDEGIKNVKIKCHNSEFGIDGENLEEIIIEEISNYGYMFCVTKVYINNCKKLKYMEGADFIIDDYLFDVKKIKNKGKYPNEATLNSLPESCSIEVYGLNCATLYLNKYKPDKRINYLSMDYQCTVDEYFISQLEGLEYLCISNSTIASCNIEIIKNNNLKTLILEEHGDFGVNISCKSLNKLVITTSGGSNIKLNDLPIIDYPSSITSLEIYIPCKDYNLEPGDCVKYWCNTFENLQELNLSENNPLSIYDFVNSREKIKKITYRGSNKCFDELTLIFPNLIKDICSVST